MKAVFIHDHNFVYNAESDLYYDGSGGAFDENLWNRYLAIFDNLIVVGRQIDTLPNKLVLSSTANVKFNLIKGASGTKNILKNKFRIVKELESIINGVDFAIIRLPSSLGSWAFDICKKLDVKCVLEIVGDPFEAYWHHGNILGKLIAPIELMKLKGIVKNANNVIYVTQDILQKRYPCPNFTIGISNVRLDDVVEESSVRKFYSNEIETFRIGLIGSFHVRYKGHVEALQALKFVKDQGFSNIELALVGTGDSSWIRDLIKKYGLEAQVKIIGAVGAGKEGVFPFLDSIHLYIHPSKTEGLPRVILEAMSRGKICLGSDVGGTNELLENKFIHLPGNWQKLAEQIKSVIKATQEEKIEIALNNLKVAQGYVESILQNRRAEFIKNIWNDKSN